MKSCLPIRIIFNQLNSNEKLFRREIFRKFQHKYPKSDLQDVCFDSINRTLFVTITRTHKKEDHTTLTSLYLLIICFKSNLYHINKLHTIVNQIHLFFNREEALIFFLNNKIHLFFNKIHSIVNQKSKKYILNQVNQFNYTVGRSHIIQTTIKDKELIIIHGDTFWSYSISNNKWASIEHPIPESHVCEGGGIRYLVWATRIKQTSAKDKELVLIDDAGTFWSYSAANNKWTSHNMKIPEHTPEYTIHNEYLITVTWGSGHFIHALNLHTMQWAQSTVVVKYPSDYSFLDSHMYPRDVLDITNDKNKRVIAEGYVKYLKLNKMNIPYEILKLIQAFYSPKLLNLHFDVYDDKDYVEKDTKHIRRYYRRRNGISHSDYTQQYSMDLIINSLKYDKQQWRLMSKIKQFDANKQSGIIEGIDDENDISFNYKDIQLVSSKYNCNDSMRYKLIRKLGCKLIDLADMKYTVLFNIINDKSEAVEIVIDDDHYNLNRCDARCCDVCHSKIEFFYEICAICQCRFCALYLCWKCCSNHKRTWCENNMKKNKIYEVDDYELNENLFDYKFVKNYSTSKNKKYKKTSQSLHKGSKRKPK